MPVTMKQVRAALDPEEPDYEKAAKLGPEALPHLEKLISRKDPNLASKAASLAGMIFVARSGASGPQDGNGWELDAIAAVFIGGAAVSGGIGTVIGAIIGGLVMAFLNNGLQLVGTGADLVSVIKGLVLLFAVGIDVLSKATGRPSIIGLWSARRRARADVPTPPTVLPTAGTNETSQPVDAGRR